MDDKSYLINQNKSGQESEKACAVNHGQCEKKMQIELNQGPTKIFLMRHGQSEWNGTNRISGQLDPLLTQKGKEQAEMLERVLRHEKLSAIYTSTLKRAVETARPTALSHHLMIQAEEALMEMNFGMIQGRFRDERDPETQRIWEAMEKDLLHYKVPGGETYFDLEERVTPCLNNILKKEIGGVILIVGHRHANKVILGRLMHWPKEYYVDLRLRPKYLYEIITGENPKIYTISLKAKDNGSKHEGFKM